MEMQSIVGTVDKDELNQWETTEMTILKHH